MHTEFVRTASTESNNPPSLASSFVSQQVKIRLPLQLLVSPTKTTSSVIQPQPESRRAIIYSRLCNLGGVILQCLFVLCFIGVSYLLATDVIYIHYVSYESPLILAPLIVVYGCVALATFFNFLAASAISPGFTDSFPQLNMNHFPASVMNIEVCEQCLIVKPPRAHHCSVCRKCVLKMDHHCPWINNCVGHSNMRYFLSFLLYLTIYLFLAFLGFSHLAYNPRFVKHESSLSYLSKQAPLTCISACLSLALFTFFNWTLAVKGLTQVEYWQQRMQKETAATSITEKQLTFEHADFKQNLEEIFGTKVLWKMLLPSFRKQPEDGIVWKNAKANVFQVSLQDDLTSHVYDSDAQRKFRNIHDDQEDKTTFPEEILA